MDNRLFWQVAINQFVNVPLMIPPRERVLYCVGWVSVALCLGSS